MADDENLMLMEDQQALELVPTWEVQGWWYFALSAVLVLTIFLIIYSRRNRTTHDPHEEKREAYQIAKNAFSEFDEMSHRAAAVRASLILRGYLARSMNEPTLFETHEEFMGRHDGLADLPEDLREETSKFFSKLAALKYGPDDNISTESVETEAGTTGSQVSTDCIKNEGEALLERIHAA